METPNIVRIDGINYELNELTGTATVVKSELQYTGDIVIPSTVTDGNYKKYQVTRIGEDAFSGCKSLVSIKIPGSVTHIGWHAFSYCTDLTSISIPDGVTDIPNGTFSGCTGLTSINIPHSVTSIMSFAFSDCTGLAHINIPDSIWTIDDFAFEGCSGLTSITFDGSVKDIGDCAFEGCTSLKTIIRGGNEKIKIEKMPSGHALVTLLEGSNWVDEHGVVFSADKIRLLKAPKDLKVYAIPNGTKVICKGAFNDCYEILRTIIIPDSVQEIESNAFSSEWYKTFKMMDCLKIPSTVIKLGPSAFVGIKRVRYTGDAKEGDNRMWGAEMLEDGKPTYEGTIPWGPSDAHNGYSQYYKGEIRNGVPHGYGGVYEINMVSYGGLCLDKLLYSGRWENGNFLDGKSPIDELTDEEWRHIN